jgi:anti-sigma B factor antagonist
MGHLRLRRSSGSQLGYHPWVLEIHVEDTGAYTLCRPVGELDAYTVGQFREALADIATIPRVLIDLSEVPFMDSAGLGALIGGIRRAREADGEVTVACSRPTLTRLLHTTGFDRIVPVTETLEAAVDALLNAPTDAG